MVSQTLADQPHPASCEGPVDILALFLVERRTADESHCKANFMNAPAEPVQKSSSAATARRRSILLTLLAGIAMGTITTIIVLRWLTADPTPVLTPAAFDAAWEHWRAHPIENYSIRIRVTGTQEGVYEVDVRDGKAVAAQRNGEPLLQRRTFETWSIGGMLSTIARDVENDLAWREGKAKPGTPRLLLRAEFHPEYSYPITYRRIQFGSTVEVAWHVESFQLTTEDRPKSSE